MILVYIYIYIYIHRERAWSHADRKSLTLTILSYDPSLLGGLYNCIQCSCWSKKEHGIWVRLYLLGWLVRWEVVGPITAVLWSAASRIYSKQHIAFLGSPHFDEKKLKFWKSETHLVIEMLLLEWIYLNHYSFSHTHKKRNEILP